jgi:tetratricopeptide (TPR) repeat protein
VAGAPADAGPRLLLGDFLARTGDADGALANFRQAAELARAADDLAAAHLAVAILERQRGDADEALRHYQLALEAAPTEPMALDGAATLLAQLGRYREAVPYFGRLIAADPANRQSWDAGATALILAGEHARAKVVLEQALAAFPDDLTLLDLLARHLAACPDHAVRDGKRAVELARQLVEKVPTAESHETLAMALAQSGRFDLAAAEQSDLIERFADSVEPANAERWRANLKLYQSGRTCCAGE